MTEQQHTILRPVEQHPIPYNQDEIDERWDGLPIDEPAPSVDKAHDEYTETIAKANEWHVVRVRYPFGHGNVLLWNTAFGEGFTVPEEIEWHSLVNLFAEIVDEEGDCRDAEYSDSLMPSGSYKQRCQNCGDSWMVG